MRFEPCIRMQTVGRFAKLQDNTQKLQDKAQQALKDAGGAAVLTMLQENAQKLAQENAQLVKNIKVADQKHTKGMGFRMVEKMQARAGKLQAKAEQTLKEAGGSAMQSLQERVLLQP